MNNDPKLIAKAVKTVYGECVLLDDKEMLALKIAEAAGKELLEKEGADGLVRVLQYLRLSPRDAWELECHLRFLKIRDLIRNKTPKKDPQQREMFV